MEYNMEKKGFITAEYVNTAIVDRKKDVHKGDCGKVLVIAGSKGMAGAAVICGRAAYRAGAGLVRVSIEEELYPIIQTALPEATCVGRALTEMDLSGYDAIAIGPGLGNGAANVKLVVSVLNDYDKTVVLDADGLNALAEAGLVSSLKTVPANAIITPHIGEAKRLIPKARVEREWPEDSLSEPGRMKITEMLLEETGAIVVLKGAGTIVACTREGSHVNTTGNPGMATGGSGDSLTGIIAALAGQGRSAFDAAKSGVYIHGLAGDMAADKIGEHGMTAMDIAEMTALAIKEIRRQKE